MKIVWDESKRLANIVKHGLNFADVHPNFFRTAVIADRRQDRFRAFGTLHNIPVVVVFSLSCSELSRSSVCVGRAARKGAGFDEKAGIYGCRPCCRVGQPRMDGGRFCEQPSFSRTLSGTRGKPSRFRPAHIRCKRGSRAGRHRAGPDRAIEGRRLGLGGSAQRHGSRGDRSWLSYAGHRLRRGHNRRDVEFCVTTDGGFNSGRVRQDLDLRPDFMPVAPEKNRSRRTGTASVSSLK